MGSDLQFRKITQAAWWKTDEGRGDRSQPSQEVISGKQVRNDGGGCPRAVGEEPKRRLRGQ